jgi:hypothetical protein
LDLASTAEPALEKLSAQLDEAYHRVAANLSTNPDARIEQVNGKDRLTLTGLDKLDEPPSLIALREQIDALLPRIDLTDAILEIHGYTGFADEFTHIGQNNARVDNLALSICAVLAAEACNIGIEPLVNPENPALTYARLAWVQQNYIRVETLTRANARLVDAQARIPFDSPKKLVGWKIFDCVNGFSHSKIITDSGSSFANTVRPFAFNFRLPNCIRT